MLSSLTSTRRLLFVLLLGLAATVAFFAATAHAYIGPNPSAPYRNTATDTDFWNIVKTFNDPTQVGAEGDLVRTGMNNARVAARLMPALRVLGTLSLSTTALQVGWKIGRTVDTRWLHLSCTSCAYSSAPAAITGARLNWKYIGIGWAGAGLPAGYYWVVQYRTNTGWWDSTEQYTTNPGTCSYPTRQCGYSVSPGDRDSTYNAGYTFLTTGTNLGTLYGPVFANPSYPQRGNWIRVLTEAAMQDLLHVDRSEPFTGQPFDQLTNFSIPSDSGNSADKEAARVQLEGKTAEADAGQKSVNHALAPTDTHYPDPITHEFVWLKPQIGEVYSTYLARLRSQGWLGTATLIALDGAEQDPAYGPGGVPCTSIRPGLTVRLDEPAYFYVNPSPLGSGGRDSSGDDCHKGEITPEPPNVSPTTGKCEYETKIEALVFSWDVSRDLNPGRFDEACEAAWDYFLYSTPGSDANTAQRDPDTGFLQDPEIRGYLNC